MRKLLIISLLIFTKNSRFIYTLCASNTLLQKWDWQSEKIKLGISLATSTGLWILDAICTFVISRWLWLTKENDAEQEIVRDCWSLPPSLAAVLPWNVPLPPVLPSRMTRGAPRAPTVTRRLSLPTTCSRPIRDRSRVRPTYSCQSRTDSIQHSAWFGLFKANLKCINFWSSLLNMINSCFIEIKSSFSAHQSDSNAQSTALTK